MRWTILVVAAAIAAPGWAGTLSVGTGAQWYFSSFPDLAGYIQQADVTIGIVNESPEVEGEVDTIGELQGGPGVAISQAIGRPLGVGAQLVMLKAGVATKGTWEAGGEQFNVELSLDVGMLAGLAQVSLGFADGLLQVSLAGGWGVAWVDHYCDFDALDNLPGEWTIPFAPAADDSRYRSGGFVGQLGIRAALPLRPGLALGTQAGLRFAPFGVLHSDDSEGQELDLSQDGAGDELDFSGVWVGLSVTLTFEL
ncbi:MAG: hypothetical protein R6U88_03680 [Candidatus Bipolaricaulota bacterium]